jgi:hypothetical protein
MCYLYFDIIDAVCEHRVIKTFPYIHPRCHTYLDHNLPSVSLVATLRMFIMRSIYVLMGIILFEFPCTSNFAKRMVAQHYFPNALTPFFFQVFEKKMTNTICHQPQKIKLVRF